MTRVFIIHAGPTPWDTEGRLTGNHTLPLTEDALRAIESLVQTLPQDVAAVYRCKSNEACDQVAKLVGARFKLRPRDNAELDTMRLGLWQGLLREQLRFRFPTSFPRWEEAPAEINPPEGETFDQAHQRMLRGLRKILKRDRGKAIVLAMRPMAQQLAGGILRREPADQIAAHLHNAAPMETIELTDEAERELLA
jgi:broad specificity phosphatase PhoE